MYNSIVGEFKVVRAIPPPCMIETSNKTTYQVLREYYGITEIAKKEKEERKKGIVAIARGR